MHTEISSETHHSVNTDNTDRTCETQPAKRRKRRSAHAVTAPLPVRRSRRLLPASTNDVQPQAGHGYPSTLVDNSHHYTSRTSRSPSAEAVPVAEYQEWPFQGFLKRTKIEDDVTYNLEFHLPRTLEHFRLPIHAHALDNGSDQAMSAPAGTPHSAVSYSEVEPATLRAKRKRVPWRPDENKTILRMKEQGCSWEEIHTALPHRTSGAIQVQYSTKLKK
jgi:hypothetical protein